MNAVKYYKGLSENDKFGFGATIAFLIVIPLAVYFGIHASAMPNKDPNKGWVRIASETSNTPQILEKCVGTSLIILTGDINKKGQSQQSIETKSSLCYGNQ